MDKQILKFLEQINNKLDVLNMKVDHQGTVLDEHSLILKEHGETLNNHGQLLKNQGETLKEHGLILGTLKVGQEGLKAEINELRLQNAKEFGEIKEKISGIEVSVEMLREDSWNNRKDILRVQKTIGLK
jgi:hypothetical protein